MNLVIQSFGLVLTSTWLGIFGQALTIVGNIVTWSSTLIVATTRSKLGRLRDIYGGEDLIFLDYSTILIAAWR